MNGKILLVGVGPGDLDLLTLKAWNVLQEADVVIAHDDCLEQIEPFTFGKETLGREMTPVERIELALSRASEGKFVVIAVPGDPGLYSAAGTLMEHTSKQGSKVAIEIIPGVTAMLAAAARLGAPLGQDFAVVSVGERNTPWNVIEKKIVKASEANMVLVIYNPLGKIHRRFAAVAKLLVKLRSPDTPVGVVTSASLPDERVRIIRLKNLARVRIKPLSTLIIGNSDAFVDNGRMITPRIYNGGY